ncbi:unnamed protein product [Mycena citricolor]|uniref:Uncharacterized protein n=1 Tax=Mycena citricolor TaxID=2018698 RepID=A0AAD2HXA3_9AGAR|nr:unnamed protein product [Mycena citricolor]
MSGTRTSWPVGLGECTQVAFDLFVRPEAGRHSRQWMAGLLHAQGSCHDLDKWNRQHEQCAEESGSYQPTPKSIKPRRPVRDKDETQAIVW